MPCPTACRTDPEALLPRSGAGNGGTAAPNTLISRQLLGRKVLSPSTGSTHHKTSPSCGPVAMLSGSSIRLQPEAENRTTRVLPNPDNPCATDMLMPRSWTFAAGSARLAPNRGPRGHASGGGPAGLDTFGKPIRPYRAT